MKKRGREKQKDRGENRGRELVCVSAVLHNRVKGDFTASAHQSQLLRCSVITSEEDSFFLADGSRVKRSRVVALTVVTATHTFTH